MKHVSLNHEVKQVKDFIFSLAEDPAGSILEFDGRPVARITPIVSDEVDEEKLKEAILSRRDESRKLNDEWEHVDREVWERNGK